LSHIIGRSRDIFSDADGEFHVLDEAEIEANAHITRELANARTIPENSKLKELSGVRAVRVGLICRSTAIPL
jgi:hypothetical protein